MKRLSALLLAAAAVFLGGCATGRQARSVQPSGFLGDNKSLLKPGKEGEELLVYRKPDVDWSSYKKILLEPVTIWGDTTWKKLSNDQYKDLQKLVDSFGTTLYQKLSKDYVMVDKPEADTLRIQVALTNGETADVPLKVATKAVPYGGAAGFLWTFITGKPPFVGEASIEFMVKNSQSGDLLAAGADRRVGADTILAGESVNKDYLSSWGDLKYALDFWSDDVVYRLCVLRAGTDCVVPKKGLAVPTS